MNTKVKVFSGIAILSAILYLTFPALPRGAGNTQATNADSKMSIRMNGLSADTFLVEEATNTNGFLNVGRDEIANTTTLDFSYATPDPTDPEIAYLIQGSGEIPNSAFTVSSTSAHLSVTTPFPSHRCVVNIVAADYICNDSTPITFDLTWVKNGYGSIREKTQRTQTFGPVTIKFKGEYESVSAVVDGIWTGHTAADMFGNLVDSKNNTNLREVTLAANP